MYVTCLDSGTRGTASGHPNFNFNYPNFLPAPPSQYTDYSPYHHIPPIPGDLNDGNVSAGAWISTYTPREDWSAYGPTTARYLSSSSHAGSVSLNPTDVAPILPPEQSLVQSVVTASTARCASPHAQGSDDYHWLRRNTGVAAGKTRTKDKYRVVYSEHQRVELEKEYRCSRYISIRRKAQLALALSLSERQVKIWFQNRRAKERKLSKRRLQPPPPPPPLPTPASPDLGNHASAISMATSISSSSSTGLLTNTIAMSIKEDF
ncbi:hypothetical protein ACEWY4_015594 [Coilia grayii]|uniref:Homeobox domain-containing protein n=1 Tax=Coilia grayii TaxID=363190 RepID=A0ABD1JPU1_9TELE